MSSAVCLAAVPPRTLLHRSRAPVSASCVQSSTSRRRARCAARAAAAARAEDEIEPVPPAQLSALSSINEEAEWLGRMIQCWADEEWAAVELRSIHAELGAAAGQAYLRLRQRGDTEDMGDIVLGLATELMTSFEFGPTFTGAFEVANKCVELLMLRQGYDVCCTSHSDRTAIERYEAQLSAGSS